MAASKPKYPLGSPQEHIEMCKTHDLPIDVICEDCDEFICATCAKTDHRDHEWNTLPTAANEMRRGLLKFLTKIKEGDLPRIDEKIEKVSKQVRKNKDLCDSEIKMLHKHFDKIMAKLTEIMKDNERRLTEELDVKNKKLNSEKSKLNKKKKEMEEMIEFMEDNKSTMSDYSFIDNHRELTKKMSGLDLDVEMKSCKHSVRYSKGEISDEVLKNMIGEILDVNNISLTETNSFIYGDKVIIALRVWCEDHCYIRELGSDNLEQVNRCGEIKHKYNIKANDMYVNHNNGDVNFTDYYHKSISCLSPSGSVSTVISTDPLIPGGICQSVDGGLLLTLLDEESDRYKLESQSRRLVRHITVTGDVIHEYEYQEDGQTRLFTSPVRVTQNRNTDICVVNRTSVATGELVIMSPSGHMKYVYRGQNQVDKFNPTDVVCDYLCNILVTDVDNKQIHLLSPDGEFLKFLLTENEMNSPFRLSLYKSLLWVGNYVGLVKVFQYRMQYT
ncbi:uncharacterized protein LOC134262296 [Saccostrea cucullata]|uniref:uncharacterized protein LOC134262296 n=1 Tax=Saccostrea cuccullata TaxID=36930 RepID=UPI002ED41FB9